ncbi:MAG: UDP-N-acetylmuramate dehydrogenase [Rickettsiales bacterium]
MLARLPKVEGQYRENFDLGKLSWFNVPGIVEILYKPASTSDLCQFLANKPKDIPVFVFGVGSNILIRDSGFKGVAIRLGREFNYLNCDKNIITTGCAVLDLNLALYAMENSLTGLEFFSGIPGTVGGALAMNAGAYGREINDVLISAKAISQTGELKEFTVDEIGFTYRGKSLDSSWIFTEATLRAEAGNKEEIKKRIEEIQQRRATTQPIKAKTGGSTFKNPAGHKAWELIDKAGCRGLQIGGASMSSLHCNFLINDGTATAQDIEDLIKEVKHKVARTQAIELEEEIKIF